METRVLGNTGLRVSVIGFGAAPLGDEYGKLDPEEARRAVHLAIDLGINNFDTAPYYGRTLSETRLGDALKGKRDKVVLATKVARYDMAGFDFSAATVTRTAEESLRRLQTDYVDILHIHDVEFGDRRQIVDETIPAVRKLQAQGKARFIGITGLPLSILQHIASQAPVDCILSYCRYNLLNRDLVKSLGPFCREHGIGLFNASPLHMQLLGGSGVPPWHPAPEVVREAAAQVVALCRKRNVAPGALALAFAASHPDLASTFSGISTCEQVHENVAAIEQSFDGSLLEEIDTISRSVRGYIWPSGRPENQDATGESAGAPSL